MQDIVKKMKTMALNQLMGIGNEELSDFNILAKLDLAKLKNLPGFIIKTVKGKIHINIKDEDKNYEDIECGILD